MTITPILIFLTAVLACFGPKFGPLDSSVFGGFICLLLLSQQNRVRVPKEYLTVLLLITGLLTYSTIATIVNQSYDYYAVARHLRALISTATLGLAFYNLNVKPGKLVDILLLVLLLNASAVIMEITIPQTQVFLSPIYGFTKGLRTGLRAFGLTAGYDSAGYLCVAGGVFSAIKIQIGKKVFPYLIYLTIFTIAAIFTSRSSMMLNLIVTFVMCLLFLFKGKAGMKLVGMTYLFGGAIVVIGYVIPLILSTFTLADFQLAAIGSTDVNYTDSFSKTDIGDWKQTMWIVPDGFFKTIFGVSIDVPESDMGYVKLIFMSGLIGLGLALFTYLYMLWKSIMMKSRIPAGEDADLVDGRILVLITIVFLTAMYIVNVKNLYFFTRAYHELSIMLFFAALKWHRRLEGGLPASASPGLGYNH
ncbi:MAG: hypothetical protein M3Y08_15765 [Fibrobacterota bacterium]|nr:hypothetical protein [Fibrobacterota bacterium]